MECGVSIPPSHESRNKHAAAYKLAADSIDIDIVAGCFTDRLRKLFAGYLKFVSRLACGHSRRIMYIMMLHARRCITSDGLEQKSIF